MAYSFDPATIKSALVADLYAYWLKKRGDRLMPRRADIEPADIKPLLPSLFHPDRWLLWLGVLFVLSVYYFPYGIVGKLRQMALARRLGYEEYPRQAFMDDYLRITRRTRRELAPERKRARERAGRRLRDQILL